MVASNSRIMDMPVFPDDLVPKMLTGMDITVGWFPWIYGICTDGRGKPFYFFICIDFSKDSLLGGPKFLFLVEGQKYAGTFDKSTLSFEDGIFTLGTKPKFTIDFHHPHKVRVDVSSTMFAELDVTYRGPPLWYSKSVNPVDMVNLTRVCLIGGYDAPCRIKGKLNLTGESLAFSGYGNYEHVWLLNSIKWEDVNSRWLVFNDSRFYGVAVKTYDMKTGATIASTGRFGVEGGSASIFDDFKWVDDNLDPPRFVNIKGPIKDSNGSIVGRIDLKTIQSVNIVDPRIFTQHTIAGTVDGTAFNGSAWCETHRPHKTPKLARAIFAGAFKRLQSFKK
jgi:hypothetical protein